MAGRLVRLVVGLSLALALVGCGSRTTSDGGFVSGDGTLTRVAPEQRKQAPAVEGDTLDGKRWSSGDQGKGRIVVYNVWGSWCAPCRKEAPALQAAATQVGDKALFVGINTRDADPATARAFVRAFKVTFPSIYDPDARLLLGFAGQLPASAIPSTLIVDADGRIAARILGETTTATLVGLIDDVAAGR